MKTVGKGGSKGEEPAGIQVLGCGQSDRTEEEEEEEEGGGGRSRKRTRGIVGRRREGLTLIGHFPV